MDPPVQHKLLQREPSDLTAHRVEAGQQDSLWGVIDDQIDARHRLECPDIAALAPDDPALHLIRWQVQHADDALRGLVAGHPLDGLDHHGTGAGLGGCLRLVLDVAHQERGVALGLILDGVDQLGPGRVRGEPGDPLKFPAIARGCDGELGLATGQGRLTVG